MNGSDNVYHKLTMLEGDQRSQAMCWQQMNWSKLYRRRVQHRR